MQATQDMQNTVTSTSTDRTLRFTKYMQDVRAHVVIEIELNISTVESNSN